MQLMLLAGKNTVQGRLNLIIVGMIEAFFIFAYISDENVVFS